jgi:PPP family 3-phenylpropionic acid transporter
VRSAADERAAALGTGGWRYGALYFLSFAGTALYGIYGNVYFRRRGVSNIQIGVLAAIAAWVGTFALPVWGVVSDAFRRRRTPIALAYAATAALFPLFWVWDGRTFGLLCLLMAGFTFFFSPAIPLADAWTLDHLARRGGDYGRLRSWGSVGFTVPLLASVFVLQQSSATTAEALLPVFVGFVAFRLAAAAQALTLPDYRPAAGRPKFEWGSLRAYAHPFALTFFASAFLGRLLFGPYYTFFSIYLDELGIGDRFKGMFWVVAVGAETGLIAVSGRLLERFGPVRLLVAGLGAMAFRLFVYSLEPPWWVVLGTQTLHALTFGATHVASIRVLYRITPDAFRASGQTFYGALLGLGGVLGGMLGGAWAEVFGLAMLYRVLAVLAAAGTLLVGLCFALWHRDDL